MTVDTCQHIQHHCSLYTEGLSMHKTSHASYMTRHDDNSSFPYAALLCNPIHMKVAVSHTLPQYKVVCQCMRGVLLLVSRRHRLTICVSKSDVGYYSNCAYFSSASFTAPGRVAGFSLIVSFCASRSEEQSIKGKRKNLKY